MSKKISKMKEDLALLIKTGSLLYYAMHNETNGLDEKQKEDLNIQGIKLPSFRFEYEKWYTEASAVIREIIPERLHDFTSQYKNEKRKEVNYTTYCIHDYLIGITKTRNGEIVLDHRAAIPKMEVRTSILDSVLKRFESRLFDIKEILQADLFDSELTAARELAKKGFFRAGGAVAGVVLEKHLKHVCENHGHKSRKKHPSISDFYTLLKDNEIIDTPKWRFIQHLGDVRNLCDHPKDREPTKEDVLELVEGVEKVIKTVF